MFPDGAKWMLFILGAWYSLEISAEGALVYGVRNSVCHVSEASLNDLKTLIEIFVAAETNVTIMQRAKVLFLKSLGREDEAAVLDGYIGAHG